MKSNEQLEIVAKTIYGEARGEYVKYGVHSLIAIANVIRNRYVDSFDDLEVCDICLKPKQFSCWNKKDPNYEILQKVNPKDKVFSYCLYIAENVLNGSIGDVTNGANHYYSSLMKKVPYWAEGKNPVAKIGHHIFFKL